MNGKPTPEELADAISLAIAKDDNAGEIDNLGDGESIIFMDPAPALNLRLLAENLLMQFDITPKEREP